MGFVLWINKVRFLITCKNTVYVPFRSDKHVVWISFLRKKHLQRGFQKYFRSSIVSVHVSWLDVFFSTFVGAWQHNWLDQWSSYVSSSCVISCKSHFWGKQYKLKGCSESTNLLQDFSPCYRKWTKKTPPVYPDLLRDFMGSSFTPTPPLHFKKISSVVFEWSCWLTNRQEWKHNLYVTMC